MLRYHTFQIVLASECEQWRFAGCLDGIAKQHALAILGQDGAEAVLAFDQRAVCQILAVTVQQVEGDEAPPSLPEQEIVEPGLPIVVKLHQLAVEDDPSLISCYKKDPSGRNRSLMPLLST